MRVRRGLLFWGLLLLPLGAIPLLERAGVVAASQLTEVWRLWPLVLVALGLGLLLGRGRAGALGTALLALVLGILGGGALASRRCPLASGPRPPHAPTSPIRPPPEASAPPPRMPRTSARSAVPSAPARPRPRSSPRPIATSTSGHSRQTSAS
jgi:hypothetical protein